MMVPTCDIADLAGGPAGGREPWCSRDLGSLTSAAMAAVITLVHGGGAVADAVMLAHATRQIIREDLGWPFGYNLLLVRLSERGSQCRRRAWLVGPGPGGGWDWVMCRS